MYVNVVLHRRLEDEVGGRRIDRTCDCYTPSTKSKNTWLFPAETHMPCKAHPQGLHRSFIPSLTDADSAGPSAGCSGSDKSPPSKSTQFPGERYAINSHGSGQSAPRQRDTEDVGAPRRGPNAVGGGQSRLPRGGAIPLSPGTIVLPGMAFLGSQSQLWTSAWGCLPGGPLLSSRCQLSLVCWNPRLCCLPAALPLSTLPARPCREEDYSN